MNTKLCFNPKLITEEDFSELIKKLEEMGVWHNGQINCDETLDQKVLDTLDEFLGNK